MNRIVKFLEENAWLLYLLAIILLIPALLINLGLMPLRFDGAFRGLVAFEMLLSGDYITPTISGELYFNKPPLFNWFILLIYKITGLYNEYIIRLPVIISILLIGVTIYYFLHERYGKHFAFVNAFFFITGGCIFFGYSSVGLVDITYAWFLILAYYTIYHYLQKQNYWLLFIFSYLLVGAAYMVKGLPALAFQAITLLVVFIYNKKFKILFSWQHLVGILCFVIPLGTYYYFYFSLNPGFYDQVFFRIFDESLIKAVPLFDSAAQSANEKSMWSYFPYFINHLVLFPVQTLYNMLPWAILIIFVIRKRFLRIVNQEDKFLKYSVLVLFFNVLVYWLSPGADHTKIKYYVFLFPLIYFILYWFYNRFYLQDKKRLKILYYVFATMSIIITIVPLYAPFYEKTSNINGIIPISLSLFAVLLFFTVFFIKTKTRKILSFIIIIIIARIGFNLIMQPVHVSSLREVTFKKGAIEVGRMTGDEELFLCTSINEDVIFYIARERMKILEYCQDNKYKANIFYIFDKNQIDKFIHLGKDFRIYYEFTCEYEDKDLFLVKFKH